MNLRIPDPAGLGALLQTLVQRHGTVVLAVDGWQVSEIEGLVLYHRPGHTSEGAVRIQAEVGGPYPTLGALLRDAGWRAAASLESTPSGDPVWEVRKWGGAFFALRNDQLAAPTRHGTLELAREAAGRTI